MFYSIDYYFLTPPEDTAQELFENARGYMQEKEYAEAIDSLTKLNDRYPFSPYATEARLMVADAYALDSQYAEAVVAYEEFLPLSFTPKKGRETNRLVPRPG